MIQCQNQGIFLAGTTPRCVRRFVHPVTPDVCELKWRDLSIRDLCPGAVGTSCVWYRDGREDCFQVSCAAKASQGIGPVVASDVDQIWTRIWLIRTPCWELSCMDCVLQRVGWIELKGIVFVISNYLTCYGLYNRTTYTADYIYIQLCPKADMLYILISYAETWKWFVD